MFCCNLCGKEGTPDKPLGNPKEIMVRLGEKSNKIGVNNERKFTVCEECAKDFNLPNGGRFIISKKHELTLEDLLK